MKITHSIRIVASLTAISMATGCATPATQSALNNSVRYCQAGYQLSCAEVPSLQIQAQTESANHTRLAAAIILLPLFILVAVADGHGGGHHHWRR